MDTAGVAKRLVPVDMPARRTPSFLPSFPCLLLPIPVLDVCVLRAPCLLILESLVGWSRFIARPLCIL